MQFDPIAAGDVMEDVLTLEAIGSETQNHTVNLIGTGGVSTEPTDLIGVILDFFDASADNGTIVPLGNAKRLDALRHRISTIDFLIQNGHLSAACAVTQSAIDRTDGEPGPGDFVTGSSVQPLNDILEVLKALLAE